MSALHVDDVLRAIAKLSDERDRLTAMLTRLHLDTFTFMTAGATSRSTAHQGLIRTMSETRTLLKTLEAGQ